MTRTFALATARDIHPNGPKEDALLLDALAARGAEARAVVWRETDPASLEGETVIIRTPWDYQEHFKDFIRWLKAVDRVAQLVNPLPHVLATIDKTYLADYRARGFAAPETVLVKTPAELDAVLVLPRRFADAIVKPAVGGGARGLVRVRAGDAAARAQVDMSVPHIVQPFIPEIETAGELTFVFFDGVYSHAVRKRGKPGDIRVQVDWGGTVEVIDPSQGLIAQAAHFLTALPSVPTYARVDAVEAGGKLLLMELEVIEPELFCLYVEGTAERFAEVLLSAH